MKYHTWVKWEQKLWATDSLNIVIAEVNEHIHYTYTKHIDELSLFVS